MSGSTSFKTMAILILAIFIAGPCADAGIPAAQPEKKERQTPLVVDGVSAAEVAAVYRENAAAADERFSFKRVRVTGRMMRICNEGVLVATEKGLSEVRYDLEMGGGERLDPKTGAFLTHVTDVVLHFHTAAAHRSALARLRAGHRVIMEGVPEKLFPGKDGCPDEIHFFECKVIQGHE
jgi:hypothetical protein